MITKNNLFLIGIILVLVFISGCGNNWGGAVEYTLTITNDGSGKVTDPQGYVIVTRKIAAKSMVSLVPLGETGTWCFERWDGPNGAEVTGNQILMNGNKNITAVFKRLTHVVNITIVGNGTVSEELIAGATGLTIYNGDKVRFTPNPAVGWGFDHWEQDGINTYNPIAELFVNSDITLKAIFIQPISYNEFQDDAENSNSLMRSSDTWGRTNLISHNGAYSWTDSPEGNYANNANTSLISIPIDFTGSSLPFLTFWHRYDVQYIDDCFVEISTDTGKTWSELKYYNGTDNTWKPVSINLSAYKSQTNVQIRFRLTTDNYYITKDGWYVDDIQIINQPLYSYTDFHDNSETSPSLLISDGLWTKTASEYHSASQCWTISPAGNYNSNANTSLTSVHINMTGSVLPYLVFWHRYDTTPYDNLYGEISINDGQSWSYLKEFEGTSGIWRQEELNLSSYKNQSDILIRFRLVSSSNSTTADDWYIDDVSIIELPIISYADFHDDAEAEPSLLLSDGIWAKVSSDSHSASHCWTYSPGGNYNNVNTELTTKHISLIGCNLPYLTFWHHYDLNNYIGFIEISTDDGNDWSLLKSYSGTCSTWRQENINLYEYKNQGNILIRFRLYSYSSQTGDSWSVDDVNIVDMPQISYLNVHDDAEAETSILVSEAPWAKITSNYNSAAHCWSISPSGVNVESSMKVEHINFAGSIHPILTFWHCYDLAASTSNCRIDVSTDGKSWWCDLGFYSGTDMTWKKATVDLNQYKSYPEVFIRFRFYSRGTTPTDAWYVDDIKIEEQ